MREVDEVHHPEHQRQPRRDQEQQDAELQAVQDLHQQKLRRHGAAMGRRATGVSACDIRPPRDPRRW
jgi:hypothetical protein